MTLQYVRYTVPPYSFEDRPRFRLYLGDGFWDLLIGHHRWRWFW